MKLGLRTFYILLGASLLVSQPSYAKPRPAHVPTSISCVAINDRNNPNLDGVMASKSEFFRRTAVSGINVRPNDQGQLRATLSFVSLQNAFHKYRESAGMSIFLMEKVYKAKVMDKQTLMDRGRNVVEAKLAMKRIKNSDPDFYSSEDFEEDLFNGMSDKNYNLTIAVDHLRANQATAKLIRPALLDRDGRLLAKAIEVHFRCSTRGI